jgi:hypothetical protein
MTVSGRRLLVHGSLALALAVAAFAAVLTTPALGVRVAEAKCASPGPPRADDYLTYRWVGSSRSAVATDVSATIENQSPWVTPDSTSTSEVTQWVQLGNATGDTWAKAGFREFPSAVRTYMVEWKDVSHHHSEIGFAISGSPSSVFFEDTWSSPSHTLRAAGSTLLTVTTNGSAPDFGQIAGETHSFADQMPGGTLDHMHFTNGNIVISGFSGPFAGTPFNSDSVHYSLSGISTTSFDIWDNQCTS